MRIKHGVQHAVALLDCGSFPFRSPIHVPRKLHSVGDPQFFKNVKQRILYCALADFKHVRYFPIAHAHCH